MTDTHSETTEKHHVTAYVESVQTSYAQLTELIETRLEKLEANNLYQIPAPGEWSIMENLAHIIEFMPYWANQISQLVAKPGQPFGRIMSDPARLKAIAEHGHDTLAQAKAALPSSYEALQTVMRGLKDSDLQLTGVHSKYGERQLSWFIEEFVTDHLTNHLSQLDETLAAVQK